MDSRPAVDFGDTEVAFSYKSDRQLRKANFIFTLVNHPWISAVATGSVKAALALRLPVKGLIKSTVFDHFCGGETISQSLGTVAELSRYGVSTILDYSVEGESTEAVFDDTAAQILLTVENARKNPDIPFCVFKMTGIASAEVLERVQSGEALSEADRKAFDRVRERVDRICSRGHEYGVPILIDAEESWIQRPIDDMAYAMMEKYNRQRCIVFNTYQMYRVDMLDNLKQATAKAKAAGYWLGVKMVRGAYMEKERERARKLGYADPICPTKEATDALFDDGVALCVENKESVCLVCGSHNEESNRKLAELLHARGIPHDDTRFWFAQLYGMSDNISFNLARAGYRVVKYVPYGPVTAVMPYLFRRAEENTSVAGQSSRELGYLRKEVARRRSLRS
jgi:proline dehydrogenase